jgi:hypothetical protein
MIALALVFFCTVALGGVATSEPMVNCDNVKELHFGKFLWLDDRIYASEASFRGHPLVALRPLRFGDYLAAHKHSKVWHTFFYQSIFGFVVCCMIRII